MQYQDVCLCLSVGTPDCFLNMLSSLVFFCHHPCNLDFNWFFVTVLHMDDHIMLRVYTQPLRILNLSIPKKNLRVSTQEWNTLKVPHITIFWQKLDEISEIVSEIICECHDGVLRFVIKINSEYIANIDYWNVWLKIWTAWNIRIQYII